MITEDYGLQGTKITKDYRPSVRDYSHIADPSIPVLRPSTDSTEGVVPQSLMLFVQQLINDGERHLNSSNERASCQVLLNHLESTLSIVEEGMQCFLQ